MVKGLLYETNSSTAKAVELFIKEDSFFIKSDELILEEGKTEELLISPRLGNTQRKITLSNEKVFSTLENDLIDKLFIKKAKKTFLYKLESNLFLILISLILTLFVIFGVFKWGIPYASKGLANILPNEINTTIAKNSFQVLDKYFFKSSNVRALKKEEILQSFKKDVLPFIKDNRKYRLNFREWKIGKYSIPNALALPDGNIILTDKFVELAKNNKEINSVIFHEIGHIEQKHSLQRIIEGTFISVVVMYLTGDGTAFSDMGVGLGSLFVDTHYSRNHEFEADKFAFEKMLEANIAPNNFSNILNRLGKFSEEKDDKDIYDYFSSHPSNEERNKIAQKYQKCYELKTIPCR